MEERKFTLRVISSSDKRDVTDFLTRFFFVDEPLNIETGMNLDYISGKRCPELEDYCTSCISEGNSVMAVSLTGDVVGICLNGGIYRNGEKDVNECSNEKFKKVLYLLSACEEQTDIFNKYPSLNKYLDVKILSVDSDWRGQGISKALIDYARDVARQQQFQLVQIVCTSHISALAARRLGFERIHVLKYEDFVDEGSGHPVFNPPDPHLAVQVYIYKLEDF